MTKHQRKRAVLYARVGSPAPGSHVSIDRQLAACRRMAERLGATVTQEFTDSGISGLKLERPALTPLFDYVDTHPTDYVICADVARLARNHQLFLEVAVAFHRRGVNVAIADLDAVLAIHFGEPDAPDTKQERAA